jgi:hypothetical protein
MAARSARVTVHNSTQFRLTTARTQVLHGVWTTKPPTSIDPNADATFASESNGFLTGTEGRTTFTSAAGQFDIHWDNPFSGSNSYDGHAPDDFAVTVVGGSGAHANVTFSFAPIQPPTGWDVPVNDLRVRVVTSSEPLAGTDCDVYFDVGPLGWKLQSSANDFEAGSDRTYGPLDLHGLNLRTSDFTWLRLQKKGVGGVTGTGDGIDGEWKPHRVDVIVNGGTALSKVIDYWLKDPESPTWIFRLHPEFSSEEQFVRSLRLLSNDALHLGDETIAYVTTKLFKSNGISGWLATDIGTASAVGTLIRSPGVSTDGFATIDIQVDEITVGQPARTWYLDGAHGISHPRFLRAEYLHFASLPQNSQRVRIQGPVWVDSDRESWWELHPDGPGDLVINP